MFDKFKEYMKTTFSYDVKDFAVYDTEFKPNKILPVTITVFVIVLLLYILDLALGWDFLNLIIVLVLFVVLVIIPLALNKSDKYQAIFATADYLVQRLSRTEFIAIKWDDITSYENTRDGIIISDQYHKITLGLTLYREEIEGIVDLLEAKGKTFDPDKKYMIRPVEVVFHNNKIMLEDIEVETALDRVYGRYAEEYVMLTPGYVEEIIFRNVNVDEVCVDEEFNNVSFKMDQFEVKDGHPENTKFESIIAVDGIVIFHSLKIKQLILSNAHDDKEEDQVLAKDYEQLLKYMNKSVISDWKTGNKVIDFHFATGVHVLKARFEYKDIIIGWNKTKE